MSDLRFGSIMPVLFNREGNIGEQVDAIARNIPTWKNPIVFRLPPNIVRQAMPEDSFQRIRAHYSPDEGIFFVAKDDEYGFQGTDISVLHDSSPSTGKWHAALTGLFKAYFIQGKKLPSIVFKSTPAHSRAFPDGGDHPTVH